MQKGKLLIFSAPSGAGKTTIVKHLLEKDFGLKFSVSATSRAPRSNEKHGIDYYFLTPDEFKERIENHEFLEWEEVYPGFFYGTLLSEVERIRSEGKHVVFDVDVVGGLNIKKYYENEELAVFVQPPSVEVLRNRLINRSSDSTEVIATRVAKAEYELTFAPKFDVVLVNDRIDDAFREVESIVSQFISK